MELEVDNYADICRVCLGISKNLEPLIKEYENGCSLQQMLTSFCIIRCDENVGCVSNKICKECSAETLRAYNFKRKCERNDIILWEKAQLLKKEEAYMLETGELQVVLKNEDVIIKNEEPQERHEGGDLEACGINVKEEYLLASGDDYGDSDDDVALRDVIKKHKAKKAKERKKTKKCLKSSSKNKLEIEAVQSDPIKRKRDKQKKLIDKSHLELGYRRIYECPKCSNLCKSFKLIHKHLIKVHEIALESVSEYDVLWDTERKRKGVEVQEEKDATDAATGDGTQYKCLDCSYRCKSYNIMLKHMIGHRGPKYIHCDECQYRAGDMRRMLKHISSIHKDERRFTCEKCDYRSDSKYVMNLHHANKHLNIKPFVCHLCAKGFITNQGLKHHIASRHEKQRNHICPTCSKGFYNKRHLIEHQSIHLGIRPHVCEHCGAAFTQKANLDKHVLTVHLSHERNYPCPECPYKAKSIYSLKSHTRRHDDQSRFYCDICGHSFVTKDGVKRHMWRHMGEKRFQCVTCSYSCYDSGTLKNHSRTHTGERPFPCQLCYYRSRTKARLMNHMKCHLNEQKFACNYCPYTANYRYNLVRHLKTNCGKTTRNYKPRKNKAAIDVSLINVAHLSDGVTMNELSTNSLLNMENMKMV